MFVKSRREASTSTERMNKNAATETDTKKQRNAATETESEPEPPPPPPPPPPKPEEYVYTTRKSRYTEWETASPPPPPPPPPEITTTYRLEFLTKSPRVVHKRNVQTVQYHNQQFVNYPPPPPVFTQQIRVDEDDRLVFGGYQTETPLVSNSSYQHHDERHYSRRSGSFPSLFMRPMVLSSSQQHSSSSSSQQHSSNVVNESSSGGTTRRYIRQTSTSGGFPPPPVVPLMFPIAMSTQHTTVSSGGTSDVFGQQFNSMHAKFNEIFGLEQRVNVIAEPRTER